MIGMAYPMNPDEKMSDEDKAEHEKKSAIRESLHILNREQELTMVDATEIKRHPEALRVLRQTRDHLNEMVTGDLSEDQGKAEVNKLGFGPQSEDE